jgi:hypothetical protein
MTAKTAIAAAMPVVTRLRAGKVARANRRRGSGIA